MGLIVFALGLVVFKLDVKRIFNADFHFDAAVHFRI